MKQIVISRGFANAFTPNEQLVMIQMLVNCDDNGFVSIGDSYISSETGLTRQQVRTVKRNLVEDGVIEEVALRKQNNQCDNQCDNQCNNQSNNQKRNNVKICNIDDYNGFNNFSNQLVNQMANQIVNQVINQLEKETRKEKEKVFPHTPLQIEKENNKEKENSPLYPPGGKPKGYENFDFSFVDEKFYDVFVKWLDYRRDEKKPKFIFKSQRTLEDCYKTILEVSHGIPEAADAIIRYCTSSGYQGIFVPRDFWRDWESPKDSKREELTPPSSKPEGYAPDLPYNENMKAFVVANKFPEFNEDWPYKPDTRPDGATICNGSDGWRWDATNKRWIEMWWNRDTRQWVNR